MGSFAADDDPHALGPLAEVHDPGELRAGPGVAVRIVGRGLYLLGGEPVELFAPGRERGPDRVLDTALAQKSWVPPP